MTSSPETWIDICVNDTQRCRVKWEHKRQPTFVEVRSTPKSNMFETTADACMLDYRFAIGIL